MGPGTGPSSVLFWPSGNWCDRGNRSLLEGGSEQAYLRLWLQHGGTTYIICSSQAESLCFSGTPRTHKLGATTVTFMPSQSPMVRSYPSPLGVLALITAGIGVCPLKKVWPQFHHEFREAIKETAWFKLNQSSHKILQLPQASPKFVTFYHIIWY